MSVLFADFNKTVSDLLKKGYNGSTNKFDIKTKSDSGVLNVVVDRSETGQVGGNFSVETKQVYDELEPKIKVVLDSKGRSNTKLSTANFKRVQGLSVDLTADVRLTDSNPDVYTSELTLKRPDVTYKPAFTATNNSENGTSKGNFSLSVSPMQRLFVGGQLFHRQFAPQSISAGLLFKEERFNLSVLWSQALDKPNQTLKVGAVQLSSGGKPLAIGAEVSHDLYNAKTEWAAGLETTWREDILKGKVSSNGQVGVSLQHTMHNGIKSTLSCEWDTNQPGKSKSGFKFEYEGK
jgi:hypothetical protein